MVAPSAGVNVTRRTGAKHKRGAAAKIARAAPHRDRSADEHRVDAPHVGGRVVELAAFGKHRLIEEDIGEVVEVRAAVQALDERVLGVDLEHRLRRRRGLHDELFQRLAHHLPAALPATKARIESRLAA